MKGTVTNCTKRINEKGLFLVEVLIAMALSSVVVFATLYLSSHSSESASRRARESKSYAVLQSATEALMITAGQDGSLDPGTHTRYYDAQGNPATDGPLRLEWTVTSGVPLANLAEIRVTTSWKNGLGQEQKSAVTFYRAQPSKGDQHTTETVWLVPPTPTPTPKPATPTPTPRPATPTPTPRPATPKPMPTATPTPRPPTPVPTPRPPTPIPTPTPRPTANPR